MPLFIDRSKLKAFYNIIEKMEQRIKTCLGKILSQPSKIVLNKAVLSSMPIFSMGCFVLPKKITNESIIYIETFGGENTQILKVFT